MSYNDFFSCFEGFCDDHFAVTLKPFSGERGIRTPGTSQFNGFQDRRNRPLCHLSLVYVQPLFAFRNGGVKGLTAAKIRFLSKYAISTIHISHFAHSTTAQASLFASLPSAFDCHHDRLSPRCGCSVGELGFLLSCDMLLGERAIGSAGGLCRRGCEVPSVTRRRNEDTWCRVLSRCGKQHRVGYDN